MDTGCINRDVEKWAKRGDMGGSPAMYAFSLLSDVQEMIERDQKEGARQALNRAKYILQKHYQQED
jgi:hypothetical protein